MREAPDYANPVSVAFVGDDPLGLAATNERLYNYALPGFNNYVRYIRVYAALCWICARVNEELLRGEASSKQAKSLFRVAREKMELALVWANPQSPQLAGMRRKFPTGNGTASMRFAWFGESTATLFAAVTYRPSLSSGLGFLRQKARNIWVCTPQGQELADAYGEVVASTPGGKWLGEFGEDKLAASEARITKLAGALNVQSPSDPERAAFLERFFPSKIDACETADDRRRWKTLLLVMHAVQATCRARRSAGVEQSATEDEIRACMARGVAFDGTRIDMPDLQKEQAVWAVLQVRQLQRLSMEVLFSVVEHWIERREIGGGSQKLEDCVIEISGAGVRALGPERNRTVAEGIERFRQALANHPTLYGASVSTALGRQNADLFSLMQRLEDESKLAIGAEGCIGVAEAYDALLLCAVESALLANNPHAREVLERDKDVGSLQSLERLVREKFDHSVEDFLRHVIHQWVIARHFTVATARAMNNDGKNRFRFVVGDYGLERFDKVSRPLRPARSFDRLQHALMLCAQAGLLRSTSGGYRVTPAGLRRLPNAD